MSKSKMSSLINYKMRVTLQECKHESFSFPLPFAVIHGALFIRSGPHAGGYHDGI